MSCRFVDTYFPHWFVFGGYSDPGFKHTNLYNAAAPCDIADGNGDVFQHLPYPIAEKLVNARKEFTARLEEIQQEYPDLWKAYVHR